jgi:hypothetical protein
MTCICAPEHNHYGANRSRYNAVHTRATPYARSAVRHAARRCRRTISRGRRTLRAWVPQLRSARETPLAACGHVAAHAWRTDTGTAAGTRRHWAYSRQVAHTSRACTASRTAPGSECCTRACSGSARVGQTQASPCTVSRAACMMHCSCALVLPLLAHCSCAHALAQAQCARSVSLHLWNLSSVLSMSSLPRMQVCRRQLRVQHAVA